MRWLLGTLIAVAALGAGAAPANAAAKPAVVQFETTPSIVGESSSSVAVVVQRAGKGRSSVTMAPTGGTATGARQCGAGVDYVTRGASTVTFTGNATRATVTLSLCPDATDEPDETITLLLSNPSKGTTVGAQSSLMVVITDDDAGPGCTDDNTSDDSRETATFMEPTIAYGRISCPGNSDWFYIAATFSSVQITRQGTVDYRVYDTDGQLLATIDWRNDNTLSFPAEFFGPYYLEVVQPFSTASPYNLSANYQRPLPTTG